MLKPTEFDTGNERLPQLNSVATSPPAAAMPTNVSPYNLPADSNPLARSPASGGQFQPLTTGNSASPAPSQEPQRLPTGDAGAQVEASRLVSQARLALD